MKPGALARLRRRWSKKGRRKESSHTQSSLLNASQETCDLSIREETERVRFVSSETVHIIPGRWSMSEEQISSLWFSKEDFQHFRDEYYEWLYTEGGFERPEGDSCSNKERSMSFLRGDSLEEEAEKNTDGVLCIDWDVKEEEESVWRSLRFCRDGRPQVLWSRVEEVDASDDSFSSDSDSSSESEGEDEEERCEHVHSNSTTNSIMPPPLTILSDELPSPPLKAYRSGGLSSSASVTPLLTPLLSPYPWPEEPVEEGVTFASVTISCA